MDISHILIGGPLVFAIALLLIGNRWAAFFSYGFCGISVAATAIAFYHIHHGILPQSIDSISLLFVGLTTLTTLIVVATAQKATPRLAQFLSLVFLTQMGLNLAFIQNSALWFYIGWEIALIPAVLMVFGWGGPGRKAAGMKFLLFTIVGSLGMLGSIIYLYSQTGTTDWSILSNTLLVGSVQLSVFLGFFLAFAVKVPLFPFHSWQADTYSESTIPTGMLLSAIFSKLGIYGLYRLITAVTPDIIQYVAPVVIGLGLTGAIYGAVMAFSQSNLKRILAFSSMAHLNLVVAGLFANSHGISGAILQTVAHVGVALGLWWVAGVLKSRFGHLRIHEYPGGASVENRWFTSIFLIIVLASIGVPLTSGFPGEFLIIQSLVQRGIVSGILAAIPMVLGAIYMLRVYQTTMLGSHRDESGTIQLTKTDISVGVFLIAYVFLIGLYPQLIFRLLSVQLILH